jgi:hypothetical protein
VIHQSRQELECGESVHTRVRALARVHHQLDLGTLGRRRCRGAHFGTYDYTAGVNITAMHQLPGHPACDFARHVMQVSLAGTGVTISDGATTVMPVGPHRAAPGRTLTAPQRAANVRAVHRGWKIHYDDVRSSLRHAYYQGWDLNPGQLPTRYAAVFAFFLEAKAEAVERLQRFVERAAQATMMGTVFDDAATGQGLLNFFLRGVNCGALTEQEALATGLTLEELRGRSFVKILQARSVMATRVPRFAAESRKVGPGDRGPSSSRPRG